MEKRRRPARVWVGELSSCRAVEAANVHSLDGYTCQGTPSLMDGPQIKPSHQVEHWRGVSPWPLDDPSMTPRRPLDDPLMHTPSNPLMRVHILTPSNPLMHPPHTPSTTP